MCTPCACMRITLHEARARDANTRDMHHPQALMCILSHPFTASLPYLCTFHLPSLSSCCVPPVKLVNGMHVCSSFVCTRLEAGHVDQARHGWNVSLLLAVLVHVLERARWLCWLLCAVATLVPAPAASLPTSHRGTHQTMHTKHTNLTHTTHTRDTHTRTHA